LPELNFMVGQLHFDRGIFRTDFFKGALACTIYTTT
jgi:hypothetical protein